MEQIVHADIFFFVSTIGFGFVALALLLVLIYVLDILKELRLIVKRIRHEVDVVSDDLEGFRSKFATYGILGLIAEQWKKKTRAKKEE